MNETRWHIVRHAPVPNPAQRIYGASDRPADTSNEDAFRVLAGRLPPGSVSVTSHLMRTRQTLDAIRAAGLGLPDPVVDARLGEQDLGDWTGRTYDEVRALQGDGWNRFWLAPANEVPPGGESFAGLALRVHECLEQLSECWRGRNVVCVAHGGTIRAALALALGIEPAHALGFSVDTLSTTLIDRLHPEPGFDGGWRVRGTNLPAR